MTIINKHRLLNLIFEEKWNLLVHEFSVDTISHILSYKDNMTLAYDLFFKNLYSDEIQDFSVRLFFAVHKTYATEWNMDWKNSAFLGKLCSITWRYDKMYECYKDAYNNLVDAPDSLLLLLASCNSTPGVPPISNQESEEYLKRAIAKKMTYEAALMMKGLAIDKADKEQEEYWENMCQKLEEGNIHTETIIPMVLSAQNRN